MPPYNQYYASAVTLHIALTTHQTRANILGIHSDGQQQEKCVGNKGRYYSQPTIKAKQEYNAPPNLPLFHRLIY